MTALVALAVLVAQQEVPNVGELPKFSVDVVGEPLGQAPATGFGNSTNINLGLKGLIYEIPEGSTQLPKFKKLQPIGTIYTNSLNIPKQDFTIGFPGVTTRNEWFAIDYTGQIYIRETGWYGFILASDDGSCLYIDGKRVIDNDGVHGMIKAEGATKLAVGQHSIRLSYFQGPRFSVGLMFGVRRPEDKQWILFDMRLFRPPAQ